MTQPTKEQIEILRRARARKVTDRAVAEQLGVNRHQVSRWRAQLGMTNPRGPNNRAVGVATDAEAAEPAVIVPAGDPLGQALARYFAERGPRP